MPDPQITVLALYAVFFLAAFGFIGSFFMDVRKILKANKQLKGGQHEDA